MWTDATGDGRLDLIAVGEWMPVRVFAQEENGQLAERTEAAGFGETSGWWNAVHAADLDGDEDLVIGNLGLNSMLQTTPGEPVRLYINDFINDFDYDGRPDPILTYYNDGTSYPFYGRDILAQQIRSLELDAFRERLGSELTIMLIDAIGHGIEVHAVDRTRYRKAISFLKERYLITI